MIACSEVDALIILTSGQDVTEYLLHGLIDERWTAYEEFVETNAEGPDVHRCGVIPSTENLRRKIVGRTDNATLT